MSDREPVGAETMDRSIYDGLEPYEVPPLSAFPPGAIAHPYEPGTDDLCAVCFAVAHDPKHV